MTESNNTKRVLLKDTLGNFLIPYTGNLAPTAADVAAVDKLGVIKPDGTTTAVAADGTLSVIGGGSSQILPSDYTITVATDGTGDFTDIQSALDSLSGKVCAGDVTIDIKAGTYNITQQIDTNVVCNIRKLIIKGASTDTTIINAGTSSNNVGCFLVPKNHEGTILFQNLTMQSPNTNKAQQAGIYHFGSNTIILDKVKFKNYRRGAITYIGRIIALDNQSAIYAENCTEVLSASGGLITLFQCTLSFSNCTTGLLVNRGGIIQLIDVVKNFTNVTNQSSQTVGVANATGFITGTWS